MPNTRINVSLPTEIVDDIKALYGPRGISQFLEEAAQEKLVALKKERYEGHIQGYQSTTDQTVEVLRRFEAAVTKKRDV